MDTTSILLNAIKAGISAVITELKENYTENEEKKTIQIGIHTHTYIFIYNKFR